MRKRIEAATRLAYVESSGNWIPGVDRKPLSLKSRPDDNSGTGERTALRKVRSALDTLDREDRADRRFRVGVHAVSVILFLLLICVVAVLATL